MPALSLPRWPVDMPFLRTSLLALAAMMLLGSACAEDAPPVAKPEGAFATRDQLRECLETDASLKQRLGAIQASNAANEKTYASLEAENDSIRSVGSKMDETNPTSAGSYQAMLRSHSLRVKQLNQAETELVPVSRAYNADMASFHQRCSGLSYRSEDMDAVILERKKATAVATAASAP
jgi:septal ring factor EnvC (AmiA/AmiB activator)